MLEDIIKSASIVAAAIGAIWGLFQYTKSQKLKAAEILLRMETEFREILPIIEIIEIPSEYAARIKPLLGRINDTERYTKEEFELLTSFDRALRFFFLCVVLDKDLAVTTKALRYAYYHYLTILAEPNAEGLADYLGRYYPRLSRWLKENKKSMSLLRETGCWKSKRRIAWDEFWRGQPELTTTLPEGQ